MRFDLSGVEQGGGKVKRLIALRMGDPVPDGAKFIGQETRKTGEYTDRWRSTPGFWGSFPIFGSETCYRTWETETVYIYEVEEKCN